MATHVETETMAHPVHYSSKLFNHLGLVVGMYHKLDIEGDNRSTDYSRWRQADCLNRSGNQGDGFERFGLHPRALYLTPLFFRDKPVGRRIGEGIEARYLNEDVLGCALDKIYQYGPKALYSQVSVWPLTVSVCRANLLT